MTMLLIYFGMFFACLLFMARFGKTVGLDFGDESDGEDKCRSVNATGYLIMSLFWFLVIPIIICIALWELLVMLVKFIIPSEKKEPPRPTPVHTPHPTRPIRTETTRTATALHEALLRLKEDTKKNKDIKLGR